MRQLRKLMNKFSKLSGIILYWLSWPVLFFYLKDSKRSRVIVSSENNILIIKNWLGSGQFTLPGGGLKKDENPKDGVIRELEEETGILVESSRLQLIKSEFTVTEHGYSYKCLGFSVKIDKTIVTTRQKLEIAEIKWVDAKEVLNKYRLTSTARTLITTWLELNHLVD